MDLGRFIVPALGVLRWLDFLIILLLKVPALGVLRWLELLTILLLSIFNRTRQV
jgi:hypothetical protein